MQVNNVARAALVFAGIAAAAVDAQAMPDPSVLLAGDPDYKAARTRIAAKDFAGALPHLEVLLKDFAREAEVHSLMGFALRKTGRLDEAYTHYQRALARDPEHLGANEYLGELYVETGRIEAARERLAVLMRVCGEACEETRDLAEAINAASAKP